MTTEARSLENVLASYLDGHDLSLPPLPTVPDKVLKRLREGKSNMAQVAEDIAEDQVITGTVLRMINSPLYRGVDKITSLAPAVTRLGSNAIRTLMLHHSLRVVTLGLSGQSAQYARLLWMRAQASAHVMRALSPFTGVDSEEAFLVGLLHDIGSLVVVRATSTPRSVVGYDITITEDEFEYLCYECHQEFGELIADEWRLPEQIKLLIADHHRYPEAQDPCRVERLQLQATDMICSLLGHTSWQPYNLLESRPLVDLGLKDNADFEALLRGLPEQVHGLLASLS
ncbi:MAG: HDOD domain-containing protein [bacterium]|nr:HDOD domain-containing protein [bacterium]